MVRFFGDNAEHAQRARIDSFVTALYGAYESFDSKQLKTDINVIAGFLYSKNRLNRDFKVYNDLDDIDDPILMSTKADSTSVFVRIEATKNIFSLLGCQFGPWLMAKYHHVRQEGYDEHSVLGELHSDRMRFHFIDTVVGLNMESEFQSKEHDGRSVKFTFRGGWNCQPLREHSPYSVSVEGVTMDESAKVHYNVTNSAIAIANIAIRFDANLTLTGTWTGRFSKDTVINNVSAGIEYAF
jgi:hypothetical protein